MSPHHSQAGALIDHLGRAFGCELSLDVNNEAAFSVRGEMVIVLAASEHAPLILLEARRGDLPRRDADLLLGVLALNATGDIGSACVAYDIADAALAVRQVVQIDNLDQQQFVNVVNRMIERATWAFEQIDALAARVPGPAAPRATARPTTSASAPTDQADIILRL